MVCRFFRRSHDKMVPESTQVSTLLIIGAGLFGSQAAAYARVKGHEALVFDAGLAGGASAAAAGLFKEDWAGKKGRDHFRRALGVLDLLYGIDRIQLHNDEGIKESYLCVPPRLILEPEPIRQ